MKKIIGILLAGALVTSAFAADVNAKVKLYGDLFSYNSNDSNISALKLNNHAAHAWEPLIDLSVSTDNAGATAKIKNLNEWGSGEGLTDCNWNIWFKAFDLLKVQVGQVSGSLNQETIDYSNSVSTWDNGGYAISYEANGLNVGLYSIEGWGQSLITKEGTAPRAYVNDILFNASYTADFGTISGLFEYDSSKGIKLYDGFFEDDSTNIIWVRTPYATSPVLSGKDGSDGFDVTDYIRFGLGYNAGNVLSDNFTFFVNVIGENAYWDDSLSAFILTPELFAKFSSGAFTAMAFVKVPTVFAKSNTPLPAGVEILPNCGVFATAKVSYTFGGTTAYVYVKEAFIDHFVKVNVKPGITGNVGICSWEVAADMNIGSTFSISVPVNFTVNF